MGFHITSCISGDGNVGYNTKDDPNFPESNGLTKGRWYLLEISQGFDSKKSPQGHVLDILGLQPARYVLHVTHIFKRKSSV